MIVLKRTNSSSIDFQNLIKELDNDLTNRYDSLQYQYNAFNQVNYIETVVIAYMEDIAVGCSCFKKIDKDSIEIKRMFVNPYLRGMGIASTVLTQLMLWAKESGYARAVLETGKKQPEAIGLYRKHGFSIIENFGPYQGIENSVCMGKDL